MLSPFRAIAWSVVKRLVRRKFPGVQSISTQQLVDWMATRKALPVLVDVRRKEEYLTSHLPGAHHLPTVEAIQQAGISPDTGLVLYCSVGYRSARLAETLQAEGYRQVMNLEGSIFEWYNQGYPLVANQTPVRRVHPYDRVWGQLLKPPE
jgi:rhodanese-related sulfurtransferase